MVITHTRLVMGGRGFKSRSGQTFFQTFTLEIYIYIYNNKINARVLIGQSAMLYCAGKPMEKSRVF